MITSTASRDDVRAGTLATLTLAFDQDPVIRWFFPDPGRYLAAFPVLAGLLGAAAFAAGTAVRAEGNRGAALWVPPGSEADDEAVLGLVVESIDADRHGTTFAFLAQIEAHHPAQPHWCLPFVGVDPRYQGRGIGAELLRAGTARADSDGLGCYLEASSPRNRALYERHGFVVVGEVQAGDSAPLWPMWRAPGAGR